MASPAERFARLPIISICDPSSDDVGKALRAARVEEQALEELRSCAGSQFDAELVEVFASVLEELGRSPSNRAASGYR